MTILKKSAAVLSLLFGLPASAQDISREAERVNLANGGGEANADSTISSISGDGRYVVFASPASNLVTGDGNGLTDIFLHDRETDSTIKISNGVGGIDANGNSSNPVISQDGRFIAFDSFAENLVTGDSNGEEDVFLYEVASEQISLLSVSTAGVQGSGPSLEPSISSNGDYISFQSAAPNLVAADTNGLEDVFVRDRISNTTTRVSISDDELQANSLSFSSSISGDGRYVTFMSFAYNLVPGYPFPNFVIDVFVRDRVANTTKVVSYGNTYADNNSSFPVISADGRFIVFESIATNLVAGDSNALIDVFLYNIESAEVTRLSNGLGAESNGSSSAATISADGRFVGFVSAADNLVADDNNGVIDVFLYDTDSDEIVLVSANEANEQANGSSGAPVISGNGEYISLYSYADNLVDGDGNGLSDIFVIRNFLLPKAPPLAQPAAIPSVSTWAILLTMFGLLGFAYQQRQRQFQFQSTK